MRPCTGYADPSSKDDVSETENLLDERGRTCDVIAHTSALIRSESDTNVIRGLERLSNLPNSGQTNEEAQLVAFLLVLALYRLKRDDQAIAVARDAEKKKIANQQTLQILAELEEAKQGMLGVAVGVGTAVLGIGALALAWFLRPKRR
jgi:hypothetical protein